MGGQEGQQDLAIGDEIAYAVAMTRDWCQTGDGNRSARFSFSDLGIRPRGASQEVERDGK